MAFPAVIPLAIALNAWGLVAAARWYADMTPEEREERGRQAAALAWNTFKRSIKALMVDQLTIIAARLGAPTG